VKEAEKNIDSTKLVTLELTREQGTMGDIEVAHVSYLLYVDSLIRKVPQNALLIEKKLKKFLHNRLVFAVLAFVKARTTSLKKNLMFI